MGLSRCWPFRFNMIRCAQSQHIWTWSGENGEKGTRLLTFLASVKPRNLGARGLRKKKKVRESASLCESSVKFRQLKTAQAYRIRAKRKHGYLSLSLSVSFSLCLCVMADDETSTSVDETSTFVDVASHTNEYSTFQDRRGVCCKQGFVSGVETGF